MNLAVAQTLPANPDTSELPDIQDIIPPETLPNYWLIIISILGGLLFLGGLIWLMVYFIRKDQRRAHRIPAGRVALQKLDELKKEISTLTANAFSLKVSDILKDYLQDRFHDSFRYETSEEFLSRLSTVPSNPLPQRLQTSLTNFVGLCDELKFARPANADANKLPLLEEARRIIREPANVHAVSTAHS